ncbi:MAG: 3'-5' exonuclease, partial [Prolixibacteraceae bacterium]|nr:3'-5' exonuclease [Prolixibacteraceae bacterium]
MYAVVDIETTGGNFKTGKITEIAIYVFNGTEIIDSFSTLINPECEIPFFITNLTGITNQMVANSPKFYEVARKIVEITANRIFVAHNASFDYNFIKKEFEDLGFDFSRKTLCTVKLSRKHIPNHKSYSLGKICDELGIEVNGRHRAAGDALATVKLLDKILKSHNQSQLN